MKYFGFFEGMPYKNPTDSFDDFKMLQNDLDKDKVLKYIKNLPVAGVCPMTARDIFTGEELEMAGVYIDGDFKFPVEFAHYYEKYDIGIPKDYADYIKDRI